MPRSSPPGNAISDDVAVLGVTPHALWLLVNGREHMLDHARFPWFRDAPLRDVFEVELSFGTHLRWPKLDVDLDVDSLEHPERFPLVSRVAKSPAGGGRRGATRGRGRR